MLYDENGKAGLTGRYYNGPVPQGEPVQVRTDRTVNFNWIFALPHPALDANCFSVVWTGSVVMPRTMDGCIGLSTQDSMRLYVDDKLLIDGWGKEKALIRHWISTLRPDALIKSALSLSTTGGAPA